jgi:hypothetical protein
MLAPFKGQLRRHRRTLMIVGPVVAGFIVTFLTALRAPSSYLFPAIVFDVIMLLATFEFYWFK